MSAHKVVSKQSASYLSSIFLLIGFIVFSSNAYSQKRSRTIGDILKKIEVKSDKLKVSKSKSLLPKIQKRKEIKKRNLKQVKPPSSSRLYFDEGTDEAELEKITDASIKQLYNLTKRYARSSKRGELWLRLAELYVDKARLIEYRLQNEFDKQMAAYLAKKRKRRPKLNLEPAFKNNRKAIQLYAWFVRDFPKDPKMDQALFFLGYNHFELGQVKKGEKYYIQLTKDFPKSNYVNESNFALGEYHFENERWKPAAKYYGQVAKDKRHRLHGFSLYKLAWCNYKLNRTKQGLDNLEEVILIGRRTKTAGSKGVIGVSRIRLAKEAIKDLVVFYAEAGDYKSAEGYFSKIIGAKTGRATLVRLATYYMDTGNRTAATYHFRQFIKEDPDSPRAFDFQSNIVKMAQAGGVASSGYRKELNAWVSTYGPGSDWQSENRRDKEAISRANETIEFTLRNYTLQQHQTAQNARTKSAQINAKEGYILYLRTFRNTEKSHEMRFFLGELLFDIGDYAGAAKQYDWVIVNAPKSEYVNKSLLNSLLAREKKLPQPNEIKTIVGDKTDPVEFTADVKDFETSAYRFLEKIPKSKNRTAIKYRLGALYYYFNQYNKAIPIFREVIKESPKSDFAKFSANLLLDIYNVRKDYASLNSAADEIMAIPDLARSSVGAQIRDIKIQSAFKGAKDLESKEKYEDSAKAYESFSSKNAGNILAFTALFNAAVNYEKAGDLNKAIDMYIRVLNARGKIDKDLQYKAFKYLPSLMEKIGQYLRAARNYEAFARKYPKDKVSLQYHLNAATYFDALNVYKSAKRNYETYYDQARGSSRHDILFYLGRMHERMRSWSWAIGYYDRFLKSGTVNALAVVEACFRIAKIHELRNKNKYAQEWYEKTVYTQKALAKKGQNVGVGIAAEARFKMVEPIYKDLIRIKIPGSGRAQAKAVDKKLGLINQLKEKLKDVVAYDDAFQVVSALTLQGKALEHMYAALISVPIPKGLNKTEKAQYLEGIKGVADPFKEQAVETYKLSIQKGIELQAYSYALKEAVAKLAQFTGKQQPAANAYILPVELVDIMETKLDIKFKRALNSRDEDEVIASASKILGKNPDHVTTLNGLGVFYYWKKKYAMSKLIFQRAMEIDKNNSVLLNNLGAVYLAEDDMRIALDNFRKSRKQGGSDRGAQNLSTIFVTYGDYKRAVDPLSDAYDEYRSKLRKSDGRGIAVANNYAVALMGAAKSRRANSVFETIVESGSRSAEVHYNYAILLVEVLKNKSTAQKILSKIQYMTEDRRLLKKAAELEKKVL